MPFLSFCGKVDEDGAFLARVLERRAGKQNAIDGQGLMQIDLDAVVVGQHAEADRVLAAEEFLVGVEADVEVVVQQVVVGAVAAVFATEELGAGRRRLLSRLLDGRSRRGRHWIRRGGARGESRRESKRRGDACGQGEIRHGLARGREYGGGWFKSRAPFIYTKRPHPQ